MNSTPQPSSISWKNFRLPIIQQGFAWVLSAFVADFGVLNTWVSCIILTYWLIAVIIGVFRPSRLTRVHAAYIRWGFLCIAIICLLLGNYLFTAIVGLLLEF